MKAADTMKTRKLKRSGQDARLEQARAAIHDFRMPLNVSDDDIREFVFRFQMKNEAKKKEAVKN